MSSTVTLTVTTTEETVTLTVIEPTFSTAPVTTKGDLYGFSTVGARVPVGANGTFLQADSTQALGVKYAAAAGGGDVTASAALDNDKILVGDGGVKGIKDSTASISDITTNSAKNTNANHTGDASGSAGLTLATVNSNIGSFTNADLTVNGKGLITAASNGSAAPGDVTAAANLTDDALMAGDGGAKGAKTITPTAARSLLNVEDGSEANNISDGNATDLTDSGNTTLHIHDADRARANHTGSQAASTISDFDAEVANETSVAANTAYRGVGHVPLSQKGAANGVAELDASSKLPAAQLPVSATEYKGAWNANTNTPTLVDATGTNGDLYRTSVAGSQDLGAGSETYAVGDAVIYNGSIWQKIPSEDLIQSVNSKVGVVVLDTDDVGEGATNKYLSAAQKTDLTDGNASTAHYHDADRARANHTGSQAPATIQVAADNRILGNDNGTTQGAQELTATEVRSLISVENGAEANNISDGDATDLTDSGESTLHYHDADRVRSNHTGNKDATVPETITGQTVAAGTAVHLTDADTWSAADADAEATCDSMLGVRVSATVVQTGGVWITSGLTAAATYFVSLTSGAITNDVSGFTAGDIVRVIGYALSTTKLLVRPSDEWTEITA